jgi:hypothetical protein
VIARLAASLVLGLLPVIAAAAPPIKLSELPAKPVRYGRPKSVPKVDYDASSARVTVDAPLCVIATPPEHWTSGEDDLESENRDEYADSRQAFGIERMFELDGHMVLERTRADIASSEIRPLERSWIQLAAVAHAGNHTVYAFRTSEKVYLVARSRDTTTVRFDAKTEDGVGRRRISSCTIALTEIRIRKRGGSLPVEIVGKVPSTSKTFEVKASLTQTSRDPEPLLAVHLRVSD